MIGFISVHSPNLHTSGPDRIEINVMPTERIIRTIIKTLSIGQSLHLTSGEIDPINIVITSSLGMIN